MKTACLAPRTGVPRRMDFSIVRGRVSAVRELLRFVACGPSRALEGRLLTVL